MWPIFLLFAVQGIAFALMDMHDQAVENEYPLEDDWY